MNYLETGTIWLNIYHQASMLKSSSPAENQWKVLEPVRPVLSDLQKRER